MIPEAEGATPIGIFLLGDAFLKAARDTAGNGRKLTSGPTRLLCYHACELFLKALLREHGRDIDTLRDYGHDLGRMLESAKAKGLRLERGLTRTIVRLVARKDYVRVRYMVVETAADISVNDVLALADGIRDAVRASLRLNELGMPLPADVEPLAGPA